MLLSGSGPVPFGLTFWVMTVGYLGNSILPMRAGDLGRSYLMGRRAGMGGTFAGWRRPWRSASWTPGSWWLWVGYLFSATF